MHIKNWTAYQHNNGDKQFPWIKLYRSILDDYDWHTLDPEAAKLLVMLWLLASESNGILPAIEVICFRLRVDKSDLLRLLPLLNHWVLGGEPSEYTQDIQRIPIEYTQDIQQGILEGEGDKEGDIDIDKEEEGECEGEFREQSPAADAAIPLSKEWNLMASESNLPPVRDLTKKRRGAIHQRLKEPFFRDNWRAALTKIPKSQFLIGKNDRGWVANFDWFLSPSAVISIMEGKYDDRPIMNRKQPLPAVSASCKRPEDDPSHPDFDLWPTGKKEKTV